MVIFVGSNPAQNSPDPSKAFAGTKSDNRLAHWVEEIGIVGARYINVSSKVTPGNRPLKVSEFDLDALKAGIPWDPMGYRNVIVALGKTAAKALDKIGCAYFPLPHPSGRNRLLNDPAYLRERLRLCRDHIEHRLFAGHRS